MIDGDITQDSDGNGVYDDDFVATAPSVSITGVTLTFGPYDTVGTRNMMLRVTDEYHNTTTLPITLQIYAPIPRISELSTSGVIRGGMDEALFGEPMHLFRVRTGTDIERLHTGAILSSTGGVFESDVLNQSSGAILTTS